MKLEDYCTFELDKQFLQIDGIKYLPWIGHKALKSNNKLLIVGESVYNWEKEEGLKRQIAQSRLEKNDFARVVAYEHGIENPHHKRKFARNIEKTLAPKFETESDRIGFWESIMFHELVQRPMDNIRSRPNKTDYQNGAKVLRSIIQMVKPEKCVFLGTTWSKFVGLRNNLGESYTTSEIGFEKINGAIPRLLKNDRSNIKIYFIKHPSKFFTPELWKDFILNN
ncbi:hypothetical protein [Maribacter sp. ACAM166]|uniref:hypothetical protein n=1 Tax=Maribacter sp. ACAM166 TaxID=2508996 RepID=UPI0010FE0E0C|nr:hypothetical protein [Maribacter sp. ACAM166]TLP70133.1 hypothetical protein ES765_21445 [Maribacter sp. ACAM166]